ncbi:YcaO-like family protein [Rhodococcus erythropolis]|uniref:YcaO-like family protein n=1 Tax=Rhodococcus erythropolis TaxID=1833 RepID=UPI003D0FB91B
MRSLLVDRRTGIIRELVDAVVPQHFPPEFKLIHSYVCDSARFSPWSSDSAGAGYCFDLGDRARPTAAAIGEAVERYCGNIVAKPIVRGSADALIGASIDLSQLARFDAAQYARPQFPFVEPTDDLELDWTRGVDLITGSDIWVPAELVWGSYPHFVARTGPAISPVAQAGLAAGPTTEFAIRNALREIVERDAMTLSWTGRRGVRIVTGMPEQLLRLGNHETLSTRWLAFESDFGIPVLGALVHDRLTGYSTMGTACHEEAQTAAFKSLGEALQLQLLSADYDNPESGIGRAAASPTSPLAPWRADRSYAGAYRSDFADVMDYGCHLQLHLDPEIQARFESELAGAVVGEVDLDSLTSPIDTESALTGSGFRPAWVDLTTTDVLRAGLRVVRVVVPGCLTNAAAGLPFLGSPRLVDGLAGRPPRTIPLPH